MIRIEVDPKDYFKKVLTDFERKQLPFATMQAINATAFQVHERWKEIMPRVFNSPVQLTLKAVQYTKATKSKLVADVKIRDEIFKGTPPAKYLAAQVFGGKRGHKGIEAGLQRIGALSSSGFAVQGKGAQPDQHGNVPRGQVQKILSQLSAQRDDRSNETTEKRDRRRKREKRGSGVANDYFVISQGKKSHLKPGVYQRLGVGSSARSALGRSSKLRSVYVFVRSVAYRKRFDIESAARKIYGRRFEQNFNTALAKAVASSFERSFR